MPKIVDKHCPEIAAVPDGHAGLNIFWFDKGPTVVEEPYVANDAAGIAPVAILPEVIAPSAICADPTPPFAMLIVPLLEIGPPVSPVPVEMLVTVPPPVPVPVLSVAHAHAAPFHFGI